MTSDLLSTLPPELLLMIARCCTVQEISALCLTRRSLSELLRHEIVRTVDLVGMESLFKFCDTVSRRKLHSSIRSFSITSKGWPFHSNELCELITTLLVAARKTLRELAIIALPYLVQTLSAANITFVRLSKLRVPFEANKLFHLLKLTPSLTSLRVDPPEDATSSLGSMHGESDASTEAGFPGSVPLPQLRSLHGPLSLAAKIVPGSQTTKVAIVWNEADFSFREDFRGTDGSDEPVATEAVSRLALSKATVRDVTNDMMGWDVRVPLTLIRFLPDLVYLVLHDVKVSLVALGPAFSIFLDCIPEVLRALPRLEGIEVTTVYRIPRWIAETTLSEELALARRWGDVGHNLVHCVTLSGVRIERAAGTRDALWLPQPFSDPKLEAWFVRAMARDVNFRRPRLFSPSYVDVAKSIVGAALFDECARTLQFPPHLAAPDKSPY